MFVTYDKLAACIVLASRESLSAPFRAARVIQKWKIRWVISIPLESTRSTCGWSKWLDYCHTAFCAIGRRTPRSRHRALHWLMGGLAAWCIFEGIRFRRLWVFLSQRLLANDACNSKALRRWKAGQLIVLAMAEAVAWYGLVVRMVLQGTLRQASLFYAAGLFLLLLWTPRRGF
jgi:hypothetical protein